MAIHWGYQNIMGYKFYNQQFRIYPRVSPNGSKRDNSKSIIVDDFPNETSIYRGFSVAMFD
jgi:hypothetical protein